MNEDEAKACARVLLAVACADGRIDPDERRMIELFGGDAHAPGEAVNLDAELSKLKSPFSRERTLRAAIAIADIDGHGTPREHALLGQIHARLGEASDRSLASDRAAYWARCP